MKISKQTRRYLYNEYKKSNKPLKINTSKDDWEVRICYNILEFCIFGMGFSIIFLIFFLIISNSI